jgi:DNA ligase (NAD+)
MSTSIDEEFVSLLDHLRLLANDYYINLKPVVPDSEYDKLLVQAREMENKVSLRTLLNEKKKGSPLWQINEKYPKLLGFTTAKHDVPMVSIRTETDTAEQPAIDFVDRVHKALGNVPVTFVAEPKFDGLAISLKFLAGELSIAITRGDTIEGNVVTENIRTIKNIPKFVDHYTPFEVRGEVMCPIKQFNRINQELIEQGKEPYANPRNAAAGKLRTLDVAECAAAQLMFVPYRVIDNTGSFGETHIESMMKLEAMGFMPCWQDLDKNANDLYASYIMIEGTRAQCPYEIDGVVYKVNEFKHQEKLGITGKDINWAVAHKFVPEAKTTILRDIKIQVGRTGRITPVAVVDPVFVAGTMISSPTLHNEDNIKKKDLRIGDTVFIHRAGDVVPELDSVDLSKRPTDAVPWVMPDKCPVCQSPLVRQPGEALHYCTGASKCSAQKALRLTNACSRLILDIEGLGQSTIKALSDKGILNDISDIWKLTQEDFIVVGVSPLVAKKTLKVINERRTIDMWRVLAALGINLMGKTLSAKLAPQLKDLQDFKEITKEKLLALDDVGAITANYITTFTSSDAGIAEIDALIALNLNLKNKELPAANLPTAVITGKFAGLTREEVVDIVQDVMGYRVVSGLSSSVKALICGDKPTKRKVDLAKVMAIKIITDLKMERF